MITTENYIESVDSMYLDCKSKRLSRFSDEWDTFSRDINRKRLEIIKNLKDEKIISLFNQCLSYWFNRSELLELNSKSKILGQGKKNKLIKEGNKIREDILKGKIDTVLGVCGIVELFKKYHKINLKKDV